MRESIREVAEAIDELPKGAIIKTLAGAVVGYIAIVATMLMWG